VVGVSDPWERIERKGRAYVQIGLDNPEQYRVLFSSRPDCTPERFLDERLVATLSFEHLIEDLQAAASAGQLSAMPVDPAVVASGLWMMVHGITSLLCAKPDFPWPDRDRLIDHVPQTYSTGLRATARHDADPPPGLSPDQRDAGQLRPVPGSTAGPDAG